MPLLASPERWARYGRLFGPTGFSTFPTCQTQFGCDDGLRSARGAAEDDEHADELRRCLAPDSLCRNDWSGCIALWVAGLRLQDVGRWGRTLGGPLDVVGKYIGGRLPR